MNCLNCRPHVPCDKIGTVQCRTGDSIKYKCPRCLSIFFQTRVAEEDETRALPAARIRVPMRFPSFTSRASQSPIPALSSI